MICAVLCSAGTTHAQARSYYASPGINIGYTFGAGATCGVSLDLGFQKMIGEINTREGISLSYSQVHTKKYVHHLRTFTFMAGTDYAQVKAGWGRVKNKWGYGNHNKCRTHGLLLDAAIAYPHEYSAWIGIRTFRYRYSSWAWFTKPYNTIYLDYHYNAMKSPVIQHYLPL